MLRRIATGIVLPTILLTVFLVATALPGSSQTLPSVDDLITEVGSIEGLDPLDPVLNPVTDIVLGLLGEIDDLLADAPLVNALALGGEDAIDAGVAFSQATYPDGADTAILSREDIFADGFSSGGFQGVNNAPLLFTDSNDLDSRTGMELQRLGMRNITILGGETALHPLVVQKLEIAGLSVTRVGGPTRVETSALAAAATNPAATTAVLVRAYPDAGEPDSQAYADLLAAGPYAAEMGWPILMTTSTSLHPAIASYLSNGTITDVVIVGGEKAVSPAIESAVTGIGLNVSRLAGSNRFATAVAIANARGFTSSADADRLIIAESGSRPDVWAPGFAATAHGDKHRAPVLLTDGAVIPIETLTFVLDGLVENLLDGGSAVICASFVDSVACQAIALLMVGNIGAALELVDGLLDVITGLPIIGEILAGLGLQGLLPAALQQVFDALAAAGVDPAGLVTTLGTIAEGDPAAVADTIADVAAGAGIDADTIVGGVTGGTDPVGEVTDPVGEVTDPVGEVTDPVGGVTDPIIGGAEVTDPVGGVADPVGGVTDPVGGVLGN